MCQRLTEKNNSKVLYRCSILWDDIKTLPFAHNPSMLTPKLARNAKHLFMLSTWKKKIKV